MKKPRLAALFLALAMLLCALPASAAEAGWLVPKAKDCPGFADVESTWCESYVETVYEAGLMEGKSAASFDINGNLTIAQITVITARLHSLLNGGDSVLPAPAEGEAWYQPAIDYLKAHVEDANGVGPILGTRIVQMETVPIYAVQNAPRWDLVSFLTSVLPEEALAPINNVTVLPDSTDEDELRFYNAGILNGVDKYGTFLGNKPLTRGAAAAILARVIDPNLRLRFDQLDLFQDVIGDAPKGIDCTLVQSTEIEGAVALIGMFYEAGGKDFDRILEEIRALPFRSTLTTPSTQASVAIDNQETLLEACWHMKDNADGHTYSFVISFKDSSLGPWLGHGCLAYINGVWFCTDTDRRITCVLDLSEESGLAFAKTLTQIVLS